MTRRLRNPSRWFYLLALLILVIGGASFAALIVAPYIGMQRVLMPGTQTVALSRSGTYLLYYEFDGALNGVTYHASRDPVGLRVAVVNTATGKPVPTTAVSHKTSTYSFLSRSGYAVAHFDAAQAGRYAVTATYPNGQTEPAFALALHRGTIGDVFVSIGLGVGVLAIALLGCVGLAGWTFWMRRATGLPSVAHRPAVPA